MAFQIEFPDDIDPKAGMITLTLADTSKTIQHNVTIQNTKLQQQLAAANAQIQQLQEQARQSAALVANIKFQLAEALKDKPPVVDPPVVPGDFQPVISRTQFENLVIGCIAADEATSEAQNQITREAMTLAIATGCNGVTIFLDEGAVKQHMETVRFNDPDDNLYRYAHDRSLLVGADQLDLIVLKIPEAEDEARLKPYCAGLVRLGAKFIVFNDFDRKEYAGKQKRMVERVRKYLPDMCFVASTTANAEPVVFKGYGIDVVECQTFDTIAALKGYIQKPYDAFCIDMRDTADVAYQRAQRPIVVNSKTKALRLYAVFDYSGSDWRKMPAQVVEFKETVRQFKAARAKVPALIHQATAQQSEEDTDLL